MRAHAHTEIFNKIGRRYLLKSVILNFKHFKTYTFFSGLKKEDERESRYHAFILCIKRLQLLLIRTRIFYSFYYLYIIIYYFDKFLNYILTRVCFVM